jgi:hypothetical protein
MIKTILFGAGEGCSQFINNEQKTRDFLAIADNNSQRWGTYKNGVVIINPKDIQDLNFDEIVITTQWIQEVKEQLLLSGVEEEKIIIPNKNLLKKYKPFLDVKTHEIATKLLKYIADKAYRDNVELFVDTGTLLGIVRNSMILPWDDDIDFAYDITKEKNKNFNILEWIREVLKGIMTLCTYDEVVTLNSDDMIVDISYDCYSLNIKPFRLSINIRKNIEENSVELASLGLFYAPASFFAYADIYEWDGVNLQIPNNHKEYLTFVYGDWEEEKKELTLADYNHTGNVDFQTIQEAGLKKL